MSVLRRPDSSFLTSRHERLQHLFSFPLLVGSLRGSCALCCNGHLRCLKVDRVNELILTPNSSFPAAVVSCQVAAAVWRVDGSFPLVDELRIFQSLGPLLLQHEQAAIGLLGVLRCFRMLHYMLLVFTVRPLEVLIRIAASTLAL